MDGVPAEIVAGLCIQADGHLLLAYSCDAYPQNSPCAFSNATVPAVFSIFIADLNPPTDFLAGCETLLAIDLRVEQEKFPHGFVPVACYEAGHVF